MRRSLFFAMALAIGTPIARADPVALMPGQMDRVTAAGYLRAIANATAAGQLALTDTAADVGAAYASQEHALLTSEAAAAAGIVAGATGRGAISVQIASPGIQPGWTATGAANAVAKSPATPETAFYAASILETTVNGHPYLAGFGAAGVGTDDTVFFSPAGARAVAPVVLNGQLFFAWAEGRNGTPGWSPAPETPNTSVVYPRATTSVSADGNSVIYQLMTGDSTEAITVTLSFHDRSSRATPSVQTMPISGVIPVGVDTLQVPPVSR
ncbi:MAG: hypothetical protein M0T84_17570 [Betaproteobacteria bacterium]|nr:hypothetical protein [Betaproteobacteria bacterium]